MSSLTFWEIFLFKVMKSDKIMEGVLSDAVRLQAYIPPMIEIVEAEVENGYAGSQVPGRVPDFS